MTTGIDPDRTPCMDTKLRLKGSYEIKVKRNGKVIHIDSGKNLVVDDGLFLVMESTFLGSSPVTEHLGIGDDATSPMVTDEDLVSELGATRTLGGVSVLGNQATITFQFTSGGTITVREMGIFNNTVVGAGKMFSRFLPQEVDLVLNDVIDVIWILQATGA